jgi:membrane protease YdiL (CAAX protease family)
VAVSLLAFTLTDRNQLAVLPTHAAWIRATVLVFAGQMLWGFYQEYVYRGLLQTELVRRWGAVTGIVASNLLFTFGPLHAYHFSNTFEHPSRLFIFATIFAIGLYFGAIFYRSGNLWIIAVTHGIGDFFLDGIATIQ